ncbi:MAG: type II toxin-antitoxin system HicA family toxin [Ignavibacteria bacterium]|nr:type II toxin-antitoxin system HicA family toxin [Ignavibacteria bacterium]
MSKLPVVSGKEMVKALAKIGYDFDHQKGSHIILRQKFNPFRRITIPNHKEIAKGTFRSIIKECGLTVDEIINILK